MKSSISRSSADSYRTRAAYLRHALLHTPFVSAFSGLRRRKRLLDQHAHIFQDLKTVGFTIIPNYMSQSECRDAMTGLKAAFDLYPRFVHQTEDKRIFGVEQVLPAARRLVQDLDFQELGELVNREATYCAFTLGGWLRAGQFGSSGNGWHRDAFFSQYKAMVYLTDVSERNGPFELLPGSHSLSSIVLGIKRGVLAYMQNRISDEEVERLEKVLGTARKTFTASAGTLIIFNSSTVHRGRPIEQGERLALTNYYFPTSRDLRSVRRQFAPVLTPSDV